MVKAETLESQVAELFQQLQLPEDCREQVREMIGAASQAGEQEKERAELNAALDRLKTLFRLGDIPEKEYLAERAALQASLAALKPAQWPDLEKAAELMQDLGKIWEAATDLERQQLLLRVMLEAIAAENRWITTIQPGPDIHPLLVCSYGPDGGRVRR
jgi:hypothetical protein